MLQEQWAEFECWFPQANVRTANVCARFSRIIADSGGQPIQVSSIPSANAAAYLLSLQQHGSQSQPSCPHALRSNSRRLPFGSQFSSIALPLPASATSSRVRARAGSMDAGYGSPLTGPGAPPPAKRARNDRDADDRNHGNGHNGNVSGAACSVAVDNGRLLHDSISQPAGACSRLARTYISSCSISRPFSLPIVRSPLSLSARPRFQCTQSPDSDGHFPCNTAHDRHVPPIRITLS